MAIGPAIVVSGSVIGSGELINVPVQAATFGFVLFWAVILSCMIKFFLQIELGRYCLVHNRTTIQAFNQCPGPKFRGTGWVGILYMIGYTLSLVTVAGILEATAGLFSSLLPLAEDSRHSTNIWAVITFVVVAVILWRGLYGELEKLVALLVGGFSLSVVVALFLLQGTELRVSMSDVLSGMKGSFGSIDQRGAAFAVISLLGALGTTANELFMYPYWILEKGYARHLGAPESAGWLDRARGWIRVLQVDTFAATLLATLITAAYFLVGSAVLHQHGQATLFQQDDILNNSSLLSKLHIAQSQNRPSPSRRVWELLDEDVRTVVASTASTTPAADNESPDPKFIAALNILLARPEFYREKDWQGYWNWTTEAPAELTYHENKVNIANPQARRFLERGVGSLSVREVIRLNRLLLETAYENEIAGCVPSGNGVVKEISKIFTDTYGQWSYGIFMFGGFCTLFSTIVVVVAATGRMWTDLLSSMGVFDWENERARRRCNRIFQNVYLLGFLVITLVVQIPAELKVILGQWINGAINTPLIMLGICWLAFRTDRRLRMGTVATVLLLATVIVILICLGVGLYGQF